MRKLHLILLAALTLTSCGSGGQVAEQAQTDPIGTNPIGCARYFVGGKPPVFREKKFEPKSRVLCKRTFALNHSGIARQPLWVAEALTRDQIKLGTAVPRIDNFHPDEQIPKDERAELKDYARSGYDRGHMAPDADMPTREAANEAFALSNMSPQRPGLNRKSWADLEAAVRRQTRGGTVYVVTGPIFSGATIATTHKDRRLMVPTHHFKAVYAEDRGATVFVATNQENPRWTTLSVGQFMQVYGISPFPALPEQFVNENGVLDGSMNRIAAAAGKSGATANSPPSGGTITTTCRSTTNGNVRNPTNGNGITPEEYRRAFGRDPEPSEYCGAVGPATGGTAAPAGTANSGTSTQGGLPACQANGSANIRNPTSGRPITLEEFRNAFGRDPTPEEYCR